MKVAVVGSGVSGLVAAHRLQPHVDVTLFEAGGYFGGHAHTVDITLPTATAPQTWGVDTGFLVFNDRTYPGLIALLDELGVATAPSDMSFSVQVPWAGRTLEWSGSSLASVFAQKRNLLRPAFWGMLSDLLRFNRICTALAKDGADEQLQMPLQTFLDQNGMRAPFRDWYLLPMLGCIWSCPTDQMLRFPVATMIRFCHNHGLLQISQRPQWRTVVGGSRHYVDRIVQGLTDARLNAPVKRIDRQGHGITVHTDQGAERFDHVVLATHADQSLGLLQHPTSAESGVLGAFRYQPNRAVLHTDASVLPRQQQAHAAWNYESTTDQGSQNRVCLHYLLNRLQPLPFQQPVVVSLNPTHAIPESHILGEYDYSHPVFDLQAIQAQKRLATLQGQQNTWFCGAWTRYGFHEDGLQSGVEVAQALLHNAATVHREAA